MFDFEVKTFSHSVVAIEACCKIPMATWRHERSITLHSQVAKVNWDSQPGRVKELADTAQTAAPHHQNCKMAPVRSSLGKNVNVPSSHVDAMSKTA